MIKTFLLTIWKSYRYNNPFYHLQQFLDHESGRLISDAGMRVLSTPGETERIMKKIHKERSS